MPRVSARLASASSAKATGTETKAGPGQTTPKNQGKGVTSNKTKSEERERVTYIAKEPTAEHTFIQKGLCRSLVETFRSSRSLKHLQCRNCTEKLTTINGCMFKDMRAWRVKQQEGVKQEVGDEHLETAAADGGDTQENGPAVTKEESRKRKAEGQVSKPNSKAQKIRNGGIKPKYENVDWEDHCLVGSLPDGGGMKAVNGASKLQRDRAYSDSEKQDALYILTKIAPSLHRVLKHELEHEKHFYNKGDERIFTSPVARIAPQPDQRSLCDACATSVFLVNYICVVCGKEFCPDCYEEWDPEIENVRVDLCNRRRRHGKEQMALLVRAAEGEIETATNVIQRWIDEHGQTDNDSAAATGEAPASMESKIVSDTSHGDEFLPVTWAHVDQLDEADFRRLWSLGGRPLVLSGCLPRFSMQWSPGFFKKRYGNEKCFLHDCSNASGVYPSTVAKFFDGFDNSVYKTKEGTKHMSLKLKDWPPTDDFATTFPELFKDFEAALPWGGRYMKRDGYMNVASWLPDNWNKPDLGPKMYNAYPAPGEGLVGNGDVEVEDAEQFFIGDGAQGGTTNLHLDITDAVNIMVHASGPIPKRKYETSEQDNTNNNIISTGCSAVWDIFSPSAAAGIRDYLRSKNPRIDDPIHRQTFYLSDNDLETLRQEPFNVRAHRIFQNPGDAVFIPAGCPHQVRNVRSCIKVAVDFLSPENVHLCEGLLQEARNLAKSGKGGLPVEGTAKRTFGKREDVLQLWNCLKFAWEAMQLIVEDTRKEKENAGATMTEGKTGTGPSVVDDKQNVTMTVSGIELKAAESTNA